MFFSTAWFNGHNYNYHETQKTFEEVLTLIRSMNPFKGLVPHLAVITSAAENTFLRDTFNRWGWIGFSDHLDENTFRAIAGPETGNSITYSAWASGEPNNVDNEDCVVFITGGQWNDVPCGAAMAGYYVEYDCPGVLIPGAYGCLCKTCALWFCFHMHIRIFFPRAVPGFNGRFYDVLSGATNYTNAESRAAATTYNGMTGYLATINSIEEYAFIHWVMRAGSAWLSGTDRDSEGTWKYSSSSAFGSNVVADLPWATGEPSGGGGRIEEDCLQHGEWGLNDVPCSTDEIPNFVVEFECLSPRIVVQGACIRMSFM